jgi:hypothetical protein
MVGMAADLAALDPEGADLAGLCIERVQGAKMQGLWAVSLGEGLRLRGGGHARPRRT